MRLRAARDAYQGVLMCLQAVGYTNAQIADMLESDAATFREVTG